MTNWMNWRGGLDARRAAHNDRRSVKGRLCCVAIALLAACPGANAAEPQRAGDAQAATIAIYDQGFALVQELRRIAVRAGENDVVFAGLPRSLDPSTTSFTVMAGVKQLELLEQTYSASNAPEPQMRWLLKSGGDGFANLRISYRADGFGWEAAHEVVLDEDGAQARFSTRIGLMNRSGRSFDEARIRLVMTERGSAPRLPVEQGTPAASVAQRFAYGAAKPTADRLLAGLAALQTYEMPDAVTLPDGAAKYVTMFKAPQLPVRRVFVYDGVRFDRFQRSRRTDWNYGTECNSVVDEFIEFENDAAAGLGQPLPPGRLRLIQKRGGDVLDFLGETDLPPIGAKDAARARVGPARGWHGERERTAYSEIRQAHEYEEGFEIRLKNESDRDGVVRVVEHMYRGDDFEIVKSDTEYRRTGPQVIEFSPQLRPGGQRNIRYTVRYRW